VQFAYRSQPRAALGYSFVLLLGIAHQLGLVEDCTNHINQAVAAMRAWQDRINPRIPAAENDAKGLAEQIAGSLPVVFGAGFLGAAANRWKTQFNENAKHWAFFEVLPELNHNAVVGFGIPKAVRKRCIVLMLRSQLDSQPIQNRWEATRELLDREGVTVREIHARGDGALAQMLSLIHFGDYVSFYLAMLNEVDPTPVQPIALLKQRLGELGKVSD
jgi:glucose/mannose-6-phosphate isomerase